jgi:hypothetical protein
MIAAALEVEVEDYVARHCESDEHSLARLVRNGSAGPRRVTVRWGTVTMMAPRLNDQPVVEGQAAEIYQPDPAAVLRHSPKVRAVLPLL